jgi:surface repeat SSSPR-51 protein
LTNKKKFINRLAGSSAIVITALGSGAGAVATQIPGIMSTAFAEETKNVTATATLELGIQENSNFGRTDKFEISAEVKQPVKDGDTVTFTAQGINAASLNNQEVKAADGTVIGVLKTKVGVGSPTGPNYWTYVYYKDKNNLSKENKDFKPTDQEMSEIQVVFNKKAEDFQNLSFKIGSNNNRTAISVPVKDKVEKINIKLGEKTLVEKENKVSAAKIVPNNTTKSSLWPVNEISNIYNTDKGLGGGVAFFVSVPAKNKGFKTGDKFTVELPNDAGVKIDVNRAKKVGEVLTLSHGRLLREEVTTVNSNGVVLTQQNQIKVKVVEMSADKAVFEVIDQPEFYYEDVNLPLEVVATDVSKVDQANNRVNVKFKGSFESKLDPTLNATSESKDAYIPIRGTSLSSTGVKLEFKTTQWRDVDTNKNLKASKVDTKTYPADKIEGYTFVRTDTDQNTGNVIHFFKKDGDTGTRDDVKESKVTKFLEEGTNKVLKPEQKGDKFVEAGTISGYTFVKSDVKGDVTTHFFKKAEEPKKPDAPKTEEPKKPEQPKTTEEPKTDPKEVTTIFKDDKGNIIKTEKGTKDKEDIPGYKYLRTEKDKDGNTVHIYHKIVTKHVGNKDGKDIVLKEEEGNKPKSSFTGYEYVDTKVDSETGDVTHNYKAVAKTADVKTPDKKDAVKTGANASATIAPLLGIAGGTGAIGAAVYVAKKRKK